MPHTINISALISLKVIKPFTMLNEASQHEGVWKIGSVAPSILEVSLLKANGQLHDLPAISGKYPLMPFG
jgi:hypothetical protein